jgi:hypothetical protein
VGVANPALKQSIFMEMKLSQMLSDWVSFLAYPNLFGIKGFFIVVETFLSQRIFVVISPIEKLVLVF